MPARCWKPAWFQVPAWRWQPAWLSGASKALAQPAWSSGLTAQLADGLLSTDLGEFSPRYESRWIGCSMLAQLKANHVFLDARLQGATHEPFKYDIAETGWLP